MDEQHILTGHKEVAKSISYRVHLITKHSNYKAVVFLFKGHKTLSISGHGVTFTEETIILLRMFGNMVKMTIDMEDTPQDTYVKMSDFMCDRMSPVTLNFEDTQLNELHRCTVDLAEEILPNLFKDNEEESEKPTDDCRADDKIDTLRKLIQKTKCRNEIDCLILLFKVEKKRNKVTADFIHSKGIACGIHSTEMAKKIMELIIYL